MAQVQKVSLRQGESWPEMFCRNRIILQHKKRAGPAQGFNGLQVALAAAKMARMVPDAFDELERQPNCTQGRNGAAASSFLMGEVDYADPDAR